MSLDWRGAFCPGLKCVENMECCGILVSTVDSQMCGVVLWWVCFHLFIYFACLVFWGVFACVWFFLLTLSQRVSRYANKV